MCLRCPYGHFCHSGIRFECPTGSYTKYKMSTNVYQCKPCPMNYYCPPGTVKPIECGPTDKYYCPSSSASKLDYEDQAMMPEIELELVDVGREEIKTYFEFVPESL